MFHSGFRSLSHRPIVEKFWSPFRQNIMGPDISKYPLKETLNNITCGLGFTSQVNSIVGDVPLVEDFFICILTGFNILKVSIDPSSEPTQTFNGNIFVQHNRPFIGWKPTDVEFCLPYTMMLEVDGGATNRVTHLNLTVPLRPSLSSAGCPEEVLKCVDDLVAMKMLVALRRVRVRPDVLTINMLKAGSKKQQTWADALGLT